MYHPRCKKKENGRQVRFICNCYYCSTVVGVSVRVVRFSVRFLRTETTAHFAFPRRLFQSCRALLVQYSLECSAVQTPYKTRPHIFNGSNKYSTHRQPLKDRSCIKIYRKTVTKGHLCVPAAVLYREGPCFCY